MRVCGHGKCEALALDSPGITVITAEVADASCFLSVPNASEMLKTADRRAVVHVRDGSRRRKGVPYTSETVRRREDMTFGASSVFRSHDDGQH